MEETGNTGDATTVGTGGTAPPLPRPRPLRLPRALGAEADAVGTDVEADNPDAHAEDEADLNVADTDKGTNDNAEDTGSHGEADVPVAGIVDVACREEDTARHAWAAASRSIV